MNRLKHLLTLLLLAWCLSAWAVLDIKITQGVDGAIPIAISPFPSSGMGAPAESIGDIVMADLKRSGRFNPRVGDTSQSPDLASWRERGMDWLVVGDMKEEAPGFYRITFRLFDTVGGKQVAGYAIPAEKRELRMAAHQIADLIYEAILGIRGAFNTRVVYVTTEGPATKPRYLLKVADSDGFNERTILNSASPIMSPSWAPDSKQVAYVSFEGNRSGIYIQNVFTGERKKVSSRPGINGAPAWSPDGKRLAVTLSEGGNPNIYILDIDSGRFTQVTRDRSINTEPAWMPDGQNLVFVSNRTGGPQIYKVSVSGGEPQRLTYEGRYNASPTVSPDGRKIAMVHGEGNRFRIALLDLETRQFNILTNGRLDESPSFAPNGGMVIYATKEGSRDVLAAVSDDGRVRQILFLREGEVREPDWSPFLN